MTHRQRVTCSMTMLTTTSYNTEVLIMANQNNITRACNMVFVPLNQLQSMVNDGFCVPIIKQGISNEAPHLTKREHECLQYLVEGMNAQTIASKMNISETRSWELLRVLRIKFCVTTDHHIVSKYYQLGMDYQN